MPPSRPREEVPTVIRIRSFVWLLGACTAVILGPMTAAAAPLALEAIPGPLRTWVPWALHGNAMIACPRSYQAPDERACVWPGSLEIETVPGGARFRLAVTAYGSGARVALPGDAEAWPLGKLLVTGLRTG